MTNGVYLKEMGKKIKAARKANNLTLQNVSDATGIHLTSIWFVENGRTNPHLLTLKAIAGVFKMDVKDFI